MISIVIPHYKGKDKFFANLRHNIPFFHGCEIIVVNDYPNEPLKKEIEAEFPAIILIENEKNLGFAGAASAGITHSSKPYVFLLNNDVVLHDDSFKKAISHFEKDKYVFAVSFRQTEKNGSYVGRNTIFWNKGFFQHAKGDPHKSGINGWAEGGSMLFDKKKYERLNGLDTLYSPFYWEDIDLSYRAWKAGYSILFDTSVTIQHHHESTISSHFQSSYIKTIAYRNQLITIWKNISDGKLFLEHIFYLLKNLIAYPLRGEGEFVKGFWMATQLSRDIMYKRSEQTDLWKKSDREIFAQFKSI